MLCTSCGKEMRPVVSVDIDGTIGNYHAHFTSFAESYLGHQLPWGYDGSKEFSEFLELDKRTYRDIKLAYRQGGAKRSMPMYPLAKNLMRSLSQMGIEIWISTTRPYLRLDNVDPDTRHWLSRNGLPYDGMLYDENKYQLLLENVSRNRILVVIDDLSEYCKQSESLGIDTWQVSRRHNEGDQYSKRFEMEKISPMIRYLYDHWKEENE